MRKKIIAGNWKMNMLPNEAMKFIEDLAPLVKLKICILKKKEPIQEKFQEKC